MLICRNSRSLKTLWLAGSCNITFDITIKDYLKQIDEAALLTADEEYELAKKVIEDNDPWARDQLVRSNLRLVVNIAKKYADRGIGISDLIEEGNLGLIRAVDYFDPYKGVRFSTYAAWWIKQCIKLALLENAKPIHVPTYMVALINQWRRAAAELDARFGREATLEEMADVMQMSPRKAKIIYEVVKVLTTVREESSGNDNSYDGDEDDSLETTLCDNSSSRPDTPMEDTEERAKVLRLLSEIDPREAEVLRLHYGLDSKKPLPLRDIGKKLHLTRERIRQIQRHALTTLYEYMTQSD